MKRNFVVSAMQMKELDYITIEKKGISSFRLMKHAGTCLAEYTLKQNMIKKDNQNLFKNSLKSYNIFLHLMTSSILQIKERVKVYSPRHESIQKSRKEWLEVQAKANELLKSYKTNKSDFYKVTNNFVNSKLL